MMPALDVQVEIEHRGVAYRHAPQPINAHESGEEIVDYSPVGESQKFVLVGVVCN